MTRALTPQAARLWQAFIDSRGIRDAFTPYEAFAFGDSEPLALELTDLVLRGQKTATASLAWTYEARATQAPQAGDFSIVTTWSGDPVCIIQTTTVDVTPFNRVAAEFAWLEGEGDRSLESWRRDHTAFFTRECAGIGRTFDPSAPVVCEQFQVVYRAAAPLTVGPDADPTASTPCSAHEPP